MIKTKTFTESLVLILGALFIMIFSTVLSAASQGETIYIRDTLYVPLRAGQSTEHRILHQGLKSGTTLTLLESNEESGYSRVETKGGMVGWIPSQYLASEPSASERLLELKIELGKLRDEKQYMNNQLATQSNEHLVAKDTISNMTQTAIQLQEELDSIKNLAASTISIDQLNTELALEQNSLNDQIKILMKSNEELRDLSAQAWLLRGAGIAFLALVLGFFVSRRIYSRAASGWN
jgi:SH3 domain protein